MKRLSLLVVMVFVLASLLFACAAAPQSKAQPTMSVESSSEAGRARALDFAAVRQGAPAAPPQASQPSAAISAQAPWDRMIIRNASLAITVKDVENSLRAVRDIATAAGGWVAQSNTRFEGERQVANLTLQVPAPAFDSTVNEIRKLAIRVENENAATQDVTEEYTDLESQVRNLQATEASLLKLLGRVERMEDILALQRELTNVRGQIERLQGRLNFLKRRTEMSSISVSLIPEGAPRPGDRPAWNPLATAQRAWNASATFLQAVADALVIAIVFLWWFVPVAIVAWWILRSRLRRRPTTSG